MLRSNALRSMYSVLLLACGGAAVTLLVLIASCGSGDPPVTVSPPGHDFGRVLIGETRRFTFTLRNNGSRTVGFRAKADCPCFKIAQSLKPLDPGKELPFTVTLETARLSPQKLSGKYVTITTDHPDLDPIVIPLKGEVFRVYDVRPALFDIGRIDGRPKNFEPLKIIVRPEGEHTIGFEGIISSPDVFDAESQPFGKGGLEVSLRLRKGLSRAVGNFLAQVRLKLTIATADGSVRRDESIVNVRGLWALQ